MAGRGQFRQMVEEIGALDERIAAVVEDDDGTWLARVGDVDVTIEWDDEAQRLRLATEVGILPADNRERSLEGLMIYNFAARSTGDVVMGITRPGGPVVQSLSLPGPELLPRLLVTVLVNLAERTLVWRELLAEGMPDPDAGIDSVAPLPTDTIIRI